MNDNVFKSTVLTMAVNTIETAGTRILDKIFSNKRPQISDRFAWEIKSGSQGILNSRVNRDISIP